MKPGGRPGTPRRASRSSWRLHRRPSSRRASPSSRSPWIPSPRWRPSFCWVVPGSSRWRAIARDVTRCGSRVRRKCCSTERARRMRIGRAAPWPSQRLRSRVETHRARRIGRGSCWRQPQPGRSGRARPICTRPRHRTAPRWSSAGTRREMPRCGLWQRTAPGRSPGSTTGSIPARLLLDEAALFYQSVLSARQGGVELADPTDWFAVSVDQRRRVTEL